MKITILLVEDEHAILRMTRMMLEERKGYNVLSAATPAEGLKKAKNHSGSIDLLKTHVVMQERQGRNLAEKLATFIRI